MKETKKERKGLTGIKWKKERKKERKDMERKERIRKKKGVQSYNKKEIRKKDCQQTLFGLVSWAIVGYLMLKRFYTYILDIYSFWFSFMAYQPLLVNRV